MAYGNPWSLKSKVKLSNVASAAAVGSDARTLTADASTSFATLTTGNLVGIRGHCTIPVGTDVTAGAFCFGGQHKLTLAGTQTHADSRLAGGFVQVDGSAGTFVGGQFSGLWVDMGATASATAASTKWGGQGNILRLSNTTAAPVNSGIYLHTDADYFLDLSAPGGTGDWLDTSQTAATNGGWLKVLVAGQVRYISLFTSVS